jgi:peptidylprolyl isomerase
LFKIIEEFMKRFFLLLPFIVLILIGCNKKPGVETLKDGLKYKDDSLGTGPAADMNKLVTLHYKGWIVEDTTNLFGSWDKDPKKMVYFLGSSYERNQPMKFILGTSSFVKGIDEGIVGMKKGGTRTIIIPSELAYGEKGMRGIPPNTDLKMVIKLLEVRDKVVAKAWSVPDEAFKTTASGLKYAIVKEGTGNYADSGDVVTVNYSGYLSDGTLFDSSVERDEPISFVLGMEQVIKGWDEGIRLMKKGSKVRFIIPPELAYGRIALDKIPANSTLTFDVELLDIQ